MYVHMYVGILHNTYMCMRIFDITSIYAYVLE